MIDEIEDVVAVNVAERGDNRLGGADRERAREHPQSTQRSALRYVERTMAPVERRLECLLPLHHRAGAPGQQSEAVIELTGDLLEAEVATAGRGQLDR